MRAGKYDRLAPTYDARWSRYIAGSIDFATAHLFANPGETVLDVGCGTGELLGRLADREPQVRAIGLDVSTAMLRVARGRLPASVALVRARAEALPVATGSCDWVISTSILHDLDDHDRALAEWRRVLNARGRLVLLDWSGGDQVTRALALWAGLTDGMAMNVLTAAELRDRLRGHGFAGVEIHRRRVAGWGLMVAVARRSTSPPPS